MPKKKILHLITGLEVGGAEMMLFKTLPRMQDKFDNRVCCIMGHGPIGVQLEEAGIPVIFLDLRPSSILGSIFRLRSIIEDFQPDLLVTYLIHADLFGRIFGRIFGIKKIVCSVRVKLVQIKYLPLLFLDALTSLLVTHYHFNSQSVANMYLKYFFLFKKKITVIPNGLEIEKYQIQIDTRKKRQELDLSKDAIVIGCIGRLEEQKGQKYLIEAFSKISTQNPSTVLLMVGDGSDRKQLELLSKKFGIENSIKFLGKRTDVPEILQILDIFVLPSIYEGMSNAIMEAMATGLPIITTNIVENQELINNGRTGLLIPKKNAQAIADAIQYLIENHHQRILLGRGAQNEALQRFNIETTVANIGRLFDKIV